MKRNLLAKYLLIAAVGSVGALADMRVDKSNGVLSITSSISGTVIAKVVGPNDKVIVDRIYEGSSFTWTPSGPDGAYRYDVRVIKQKVLGEEGNNDNGQNNNLGSNDYAGGSVEVVNGELEQHKIPTHTEE